MHKGHAAHEYSAAVIMQDSNVQHAELQHTSGHVPGKHTLVLQQQQDSAQEFKYTLGAARRTELRRLRSFVKMADYMMCDTLQQVATIHGRGCFWVPVIYNVCHNDVPHVLSTAACTL